MKNLIRNLVVGLFTKDPVPGDTVINPKWRWAIVQNPNGQKNGNGFNKFGDSAGIAENATLTVVAVDGKDVLVSYESPEGQGFGSEAGNGTLFFIPKDVFIKLPKDFATIKEEALIKEQRVVKILKNLAAEQC